jgi:hypothetical protein
MLTGFVTSMTAEMTEPIYPFPPQQSVTGLGHGVHVATCALSSSKLLRDTLSVS